MSPAWFRSCTAWLLLALSPVALAQHASTPSIAVGEPDPGAPLPSHPAQEPRADALFAAWDRNHDGQLSRVEFRAGLQQARRVGRVEAGLRHQFGMVDANRDNAIDPAEYGSLQLVKQAGKNAPPLSAYDANRDGKLEFIEYVRLVETLARRQQAYKDAKS